jgi:uncharacterized protein YacL
MLKGAMILTILRGLFLLLVTTVTALYLLNSLEHGAPYEFSQVVVIMVCGIGLALLVIAVDMLTPHKKLAALSGVILGMITGLIAAYALGFVVDFVGLLMAPEVTEPQPETTMMQAPANTGPAIMAPATTRPGMVRAAAEDEAAPGAAASQPGSVAAAPARPRLGGVRPSSVFIRRKLSYEEQVKDRESFFLLLKGVKVVIGVITCYLGISLVLQTKGDFRFVIPYVEFAKDVRGARPTILDTSVIIDGRILDIVKSHLLQAGLVVPRFVLQELHTLSDSADKLKRARGRRGLDTLQKLQGDPSVDVSILDTEVEGPSVDQKLVVLARDLNARIMTNDFNLNKIATLRGVTVVNINDLAAALRPVALPGEQMRIKIVKYGEGPNQGVGYLDDGTMVVVENARHMIGQEVNLVVTSSLQTSAGRMFFGRCEPAPGNTVTPGSTGNPAAFGTAAGATSGPGTGTAEAPKAGGQPAPTAPPAGEARGRDDPDTRNQRHPRR